MRPVLLLCALLAVTACDGTRDWNVLLVTFDTTRADHIGDYGVGNHTPRLDELSAEGIRFANAYTAVPITAPSHSTILTGTYPLAHGVRDNGLFNLEDRNETLAELLRDRGWETGAAIGSFPLLGKFGLSQGFDLYDDDVSEEWENLYGERVIPKPALFFDERPAGQVNEAILPWLREHGTDPFFAWVHYFDPHQPYRAPAPWDTLLAADPYRAEIAYSDESVGVLFDELETLGVWDRTLVVFTADHGEGLGEHGESTHSMLLYDGTLRVPLIFKVPGVEGGTVIEERVGTVDIAPTVLDLLGLDVPGAVQGRSLAGALTTGEEPDARALYAETLSPKLAHRWGELRALIDGGFKFVFGPRRELFDLGRDPRELSDLVQERSELAASMERRLAALLRKEAVTDLPSPSALDDETRQRLEALGYLSASVASREAIIDRLDPTGIPPQDRIGDVTRMSAAKNLMHQGQALPARNLARELLESSPDSPYYLEILAFAEISLGRLDAAVDAVDRIGDRAADPKGAARLELAVAQMQLSQGHEAEALRRVRESLDRYPLPQAHYVEAGVLAAMGDQQGKLTALEAALGLDPKFVPARIDYAVELIEAGKMAEGESHLLQAIADYPFSARAHFNYGKLALDFGQTDEALRSLLRATELDPGYVKAWHALAVLSVRSGRLEEGRRCLHRIERLAPGGPEVAEVRTALAAAEEAAAP